MQDVRLLKAVVGGSSGRRSKVVVGEGKAEKKE